MAKLIGKVQRIPKRGPIGPIGRQGKDGRNGRDAPSLDEILRLIPVPRSGTDGTVGKQGLQGPQGLTGARGQDGTSVTLDEVKDLLEELVEDEVAKIPKPSTKQTQGQQKGIGGGGSPVKYITTITTSEYRINANELQAGTNIFGVNFAGNVTVFLPVPHERLKEKIIVINDESGDAGTNNITVQVAQ